MQQGVKEKDGDGLVPISALSNQRHQQSRPEADQIRSSTVWVFLSLNC